MAIGRRISDGELEGFLGVAAGRFEFEMSMGCFGWAIRSTNLRLIDFGPALGVLWLNWECRECGSI